MAQETCWGSRMAQEAPRAPGWPRRPPGFPGWLRRLRRATEWPRIRPGFQNFPGGRPRLWSGSGSCLGPQQTQANKRRHASNTRLVGATGQTMIRGCYRSKLTRHSWTPSPTHPGPMLVCIYIYAYIHMYMHTYILMYILASPKRSATLYCRATL